jgi:predicted HicB family RNase H-like nuclease
MGKYKGFTPSRQIANEKYRQKLDCFLVRLSPGQKEQIKAAADRQGLSLNQFIVNAINDALNRDTQ